MNNLIIFLLGSHIISLLVLGVLVKRLRNYSKQYRLEENRYTLFFGFISLRVFTLLYISGVLLFNVLSFAYIYFFFLYGFES